ncbi:MAG: polymerase subunit gamma and tau, polymerase subunit gamma/tau protein [Candidatus Berkelbacteria bacterium]|nr:polymerase subunit gamma and tau, polymerase subunit gamma/tau protein [Candidatus Berkelbacteria bacterium]
MSEYYIVIVQKKLENSLRKLEILERFKYQFLFSFNQLHMVLYRKYRPQKFADIVGQEHVTKTLTNALATLKYGHAYLFAGPRGSGKTTIARIFAKALNCTGRKLAKDSFEPCNKCASCKEITLGKSMDLIEIDAASNRGIDEIRELRDKIRFLPTSSKFKIYIIDEVHMLTKEAFNALLKTLEEPPAHAIFVMATTEPQKVLPTILSRVQRYDFHKASQEEIKKLLDRISKQEDIKIDEDALNLLGQLSFGSYRDSLSLLEQVSSVRQTIASRITLEDVQEILGLAHEKSIFDFIEILSKRDRKLAFSFLGKLFYQGIDLENFTLKLVEIFRKIALYKIGQDQLFDLTKEQQAQAKEISGIFTIEELFSYIGKFSESIFKIKAANLPVLPLEMVVFEMTEANISESEPGSFKVKDAHDSARGGEAHGQSRAERLGPVSSPGKPSPVSLKATGERTFSQTLWPEIIKEARSHNYSLAALLRDAAIAGEEEGTITLAFKFKFHADVISGKRNTQVIEEIITKITGSQYKVLCTVDPGVVIKKPLDPDEELLNGAKEVFEVEE